MGALAWSLIAFRMASRVANNVPKVAGGVKDIYDSKKQKLTAMKRYNRDLNALGVGNNPNTSQLAGAGAVLPTGVNGQNGAVNNAVGGSGSGNASGNGNLNLDDSVIKFEEGMKISKECNKMLENTEKKITILLNDENGEKKEENFETE